MRWEHRSTYDPTPEELGQGGARGRAAVRAWFAAATMARCGTGFGGSRLSLPEPGGRLWWADVGQPTLWAPSADHGRAGAALQANAWELAQSVGWSPGGPAASNLDTLDGSTAAAPEDATGAPVAVFVLAGVVGVAYLGAVAYTVSVGADVLDRHLQRRESTRRVLEADRGVQAVAAEHYRREKEAGRTLPYDPGEKAALDNWAGVSKEARAQMQADRAGRKTFSFGLGDLTVPVLALGAGYLVLAQ